MTTLYPVPSPVVPYTLPPPTPGALDSPQPKHLSERASTTFLDTLTQALLTHLHRGGAWAFIWTPNGGKTKDKKHSRWIPAGQALTPPSAWQSGRNLHFGVNPSTIRRADYEASTNATIAAMNCLYAEFDGKDFTHPTASEIAEHFIRLRSETSHEQVTDDALWKAARHQAKEARFATNIPHYKTLALAHVQSLALSPSVIVDSGGGYQAYWLLRETFAIHSKGDRENAKDWQARWVRLVGGDPGAHDLRRVLRLPGSRNYKPRYAPTYPLVTYVTYDLTQQYELTELVTRLPVRVAQPVHQTASASPLLARQPLAGASVIDAYNSACRIEDALTAVGYIRHGQRFVRPGGTSASVIIFTESNTSYHHSSSDPLHSDHAHTPFDVLVTYEHGGQVSAAVKAAAQQLGLACPGLQENAAVDHRPWLAELKLWVRCQSFAAFIPAELKGQHYRTDGVDTKVADAVLCLMEKHNRLTVHTTKRTLGLDAGVSGDTALRGLKRLQHFLLTLEVSKEKGLTITLNKAFCLAQVRQKKEDTPFLAQVREANEYSARKNTDPFLMGTSRRVKELYIDVTAVAGGTFKAWLATVPKGLGETALRVLDALGRCGEMTVQELATETGKTQSALWRACRRLEGEGLLLSTRAHLRAPKAYELALDVWQQVEQLAPTLRTYRLGIERTDRYLKEAQVWAAIKQKAALLAGDQEQAVALDKRLMRLGNQRMNTLALLYDDKKLTQAALAQLAFDVHIPLLPHPAVLAKVQRLQARARLEVAEEKRAQQRVLTNTVRTLRREGIHKQEAGRLLQLAGYTPNEAWAAIHRVWSTTGA